MALTRDLIGNDGEVADSIADIDHASGRRYAES